MPAGSRVVLEMLLGRMVHMRSEVESLGEGRLEPDARARWLSERVDGLAMRTSGRDTRDAAHALQPGHTGDRNRDGATVLHAGQPGLCRRARLPGAGGRGDGRLLSGGRGGGLTGALTAGSYVRSCHPGPVTLRRACVETESL